VSARIRAGSRFKRFLCLVLIYVRCFRVPPWVRVTQVEDHCSGVLSGISNLYIMLYKIYFCHIQPCNLLVFLSLLDCPHFE
jgi:hypothetical protein